MTLLPAAMYLGLFLTAGTTDNITVLDCSQWPEFLLRKTIEAGLKPMCLELDDADYYDPREQPR